jgi:hypothetical protein
MNKSKSLILLFVCLLSIHFIALSQTKDAAAWFSFSTDQKLKKRLYSHINSQIRFNENYSHPDYFFIDLGLNYKPLKFLEIEGAYVYNVKNSFQYQELFWRHQFYLSIIPSFSKGNFKISNRCRLQTDLDDYNFTDANYDKQPSYNYRNKTTLRYKAADGFIPFCSFEFYYKLNNKKDWQNTFNRTRTILGFDYKFNKTFGIELYYMVQYQIVRKQPDYIYVLGIGIEKSFR